MKMTMENEKYHFHSAICAHTLSYVVKWLPCEPDVKKYCYFLCCHLFVFHLLHLNLKFLLRVVAFSAFNAFFPFSNVNANLNRQLWWFLFRYIFHFYIWYPPAYVRSCAYENKKAIANDCRHSSEWKRSVMSFTYSFAVLVFCCCFCMRSGKHQIIRFIERDSQLKKKRH